MKQKYLEKDGGFIVTMSFSSSKVMNLNSNELIFHYVVGTFQIRSVQIVAVLFLVLTPANNECLTSIAGF